MIELIDYEEKYLTILENYPLTEAHLMFTVHPIVILEDGKVAGFFVLDTGNDKFHYTDQQESILLRGYSIHSAYQGRGIAKTSMALIPSYIQKYFPHVSQVVLGVDEDNSLAQSLYIKAGFIDEGKRFDGRSGIQIAMCLKLGNE